MIYNVKCVERRPYSFLLTCYRCYDLDLGDLHKYILLYIRNLNSIPTYIRTDYHINYLARASQ